MKTKTNTAELRNGRKRLTDQLHQSVQTADTSFSLSCYLQTGQSCWIGTKDTKDAGEERGALHTYWSGQSVFE